MRTAKRLEDLENYLNQLANFSSMFISALFLRAANCNDPAFAEGNRQHAFEEGLHPDQYEQWRRAHGLTRRARPTRATLELAAMCAYSATRESPTEQTIRLGLGAEVVALETFTATLIAFKVIGIDDGPGPFWRRHREVDSEHMRIGLDKIPQAKEGSPGGLIYLEILMHTLDMFDRMLESWSEPEGIELLPQLAEPEPPRSARRA